MGDSLESLLLPLNNAWLVEGGSKGENILITIHWRIEVGVHENIGEEECKKMGQKRKQKDGKLGWKVESSKLRGSSSQRRFTLSTSIHTFEKARFLSSCQSISTKKSDMGVYIYMEGASLRVLAISDLIGVRDRNREARTQNTKIGNRRRKDRSLEYLHFR